MPEALRAIAGLLPEPRRATLRSLIDPESGAMIDRGLVLFFPAPESVTGEDVGEFHLHGGRAVVAAMLRVLGAFPGFRMAEPGEFTRRAFVSGRLDLTEAEGLADLVEADTEAQRRAALDQAQGSIRRQYETWMSDLVRARGLIEAELDFAEEEGIGGVWTREGRELAANVARHMQESLNGFDRRRAIREGLEVVLLGPVNSGKSTLLNAVAGREVAIVTDEAGTTRDMIEVPVDLGGVKVTFVDSAGLRGAESLAEHEGVRRARARATTADLVLWLSDADPPSTPDSSVTGIAWTVRTKSDLIDSQDSIRIRNGADFVLSANLGDGVGELLARVADWALQRTSGESGVVSRERHRVSLSGAKAAVDRAVRQDVPELAAEDLREATAALGSVTGRADVEDVLDVVFGEFCVGK